MISTADKAVEIIARVESEVRKMTEVERALRRRKKEALTIARQARYSVEVLDRIKRATKDIEIDWALAQGRRAL